MVSDGRSGAGSGPRSRAAGDTRVRDPAGLLRLGVGAKGPVAPRPRASGRGAQKPTAGAHVPNPTAPHSRRSPDWRSGAVRDGFGGSPAVGRSGGSPAGGRRNHFGGRRVERGVSTGEHRYRCALLLGLSFFRVPGD